MYYYDPNDKWPRRWAWVGTVVYFGWLIVAFVFVSFEYQQPSEVPSGEIEIEFVEPQPEPSVEPSPAPRQHDAPAPTEQVEQVGGQEEESRTPNPRAMFKMSKSGSDEPENAGNPRLKEGEESQSGKGNGLNADGLDQLDHGLQGRGLVGQLPRPNYPGTASGKVVVRVTVNASGEVTSVAYEPQGSTTSNNELIEAALAAARRAHFTESSAAVQGGTITYIFRMK